MTQSYFKDLTFSTKILIDKQQDLCFTYRTVIWSFDLESKDLDSEHFQNELLRNDIWEKWTFPHQLRSKYIRGKSQILDDFLNMIEIDKRTEIINDTYYANEMLFKTYWMRGYDYYIKHAGVHAYIKLDQPGYFMSPHKDNAEIISQYIVNLVDNDDMSTTFYGLNTTRPPIYRGTTLRKKGVGFLNTAASVHSIENIHKPRYIFYMNVVLPTAAP